MRQAPYRLFIKREGQISATTLRRDWRIYGLLAVRALLNQPGHVRQDGTVKNLVDFKLDIECLPDPGENLHHLQRVAAEPEEIAVGPGYFNLQNLLPDFSQPFFGHGFRCALIRLRAGRLWRRQSAAVE